MRLVNNVSNNRLINVVWNKRLVNNVSNNRLVNNISNMRLVNNVRNKQLRGGDVAHLVDHRTGTPLTQVRFPGAARNFSPRVNFQCRLS